MVGASGLVGSALLRAIPGSIGTYRTRPHPRLRPLDASDANAVRRLVEAHGVDTIYFPAAQPNVEWCEIHPSEAEVANLEPLRATLQVAREGGLRLVAYSSDYVFDGVDGPYSEDAPRHPLSVYGRIKVRVEDIALAAGSLVLRTTGVFGPERGEPRNFVLRLAMALATGEQAKVAFDQFSTPTYADDLATASHLLAESGASGIWHVAGPDLVSRHELARRVAAAFGTPSSSIVPCTTAELGQRAARPLRAGLRIDKLARTGFVPRSLDDALRHLSSMAAPT